MVVVKIIMTVRSTTDGNTFDFLAYSGENGTLTAKGTSAEDTLQKLGKLLDTAIKANDKIEEE